MCISALREMTANNWLLTLPTVQRKVEILMSRIWKITTIPD